MRLALVIIASNLLFQSSMWHWLFWAGAPCENGYDDSCDVCSTTEIVPVMKVAALASDGLGGV